MSKTMNKAIFAKMLNHSVTKIEAALDELTKLDSETGDGDHGTSILRAMKAAADTATSSEKPFKETLYDVGWSVMMQDCGSTGPLVGSIFTGMSEGVDAEELDTAGTIAMYEAGLAGIQKHSKANIGDKTMMDALIPAVGAMSDKPDIKTALADAAKAAADGCNATKEMVAKFGRARNLGERTRGYMDAGARSMSIIFAAMAETVG